MTKQEYAQIKAYVLGAFPQMKNNDFSDAVWYDFLKEEEYYGILQSVKNYIKQGNKFPPTVGEVVNGYELIVQDFNNEVLRLMEESGYFDDAEETDYEVAAWNKKNRKRKAFIWLSNSFPKEAIPDWFKNDYHEYEKVIKAKYFATNNRKQLGGVGS